MFQILAQSVLAPQAEYRAIAMNRMEDTFQSLTNQLQRLLAVYHSQNDHLHSNDTTTTTSSQEMSQRIHRLFQQASLVLKRLGQLAEYPQAIELRQERLPLYQLQLEAFQTHIHKMVVPMPGPQNEEITFFFGDENDDTSTTTTSSRSEDDDDDEDDDDPTMKMMMQDMDGYSFSSGEFITLESSLKMDALLFTIE